MNQSAISVTVITLNEEDHIAQALESVRWADEVIVVDSGSTDRTVEIAKSMGAKVFSHPWKGYGQQKNHAQSLAKGPWVLNLDADERVPLSLAKEIQEKLPSTPESVGFYISRKTFYLGRWIRHGGWYPNYTARLAHIRHGRWTEPSVHEELIGAKSMKYLKYSIHHFTFKDIEDQVRTNLRFARLGTEDLKRRGHSPGVLKLLLKPLGKFLELYFLKRGILDGLPGLIIAINASYSMFLKYSFLIESKLLRDPPHDDSCC